MEGAVRENCGLCVAHSLRDAHFFGTAIQHRGREAAGIAAVSNSRIDVVKWEGMVNRFDTTDLAKLLPGHDYHSYMLHVRYATRGRKDMILEDAHPHTIGGTVEDRGNHVIVLDCDAAMVHNGQVDDGFFDGVGDGRKTDCDTEGLLHYYMERGEKAILRDIPGSYTLAIADKRNRGIVVMRDRTGIKPGVLGLKDDKYVMASEDIAVKRKDGEFVEDLVPGAVYYLEPNSKQPRPMQIVSPDLSHCFFEWNYNAHVDSVIDGVSVRVLRSTLGEIAAGEFQMSADIVSYIPRCPEPAARSFAAKRGIEFLPMFYKMRGERSFMGSTIEDRAGSIGQNLFLIPEVERKVKGKRVVIWDDSFVRGNVLKRVSALTENLGAKEIHVVSYTPPIGIYDESGIARGCTRGVDMPPTDDFLARGDGRNKTVEEIAAEFNGEIKVEYLSNEAMLRAYEKLGIARKNLCTYCTGGKGPNMDK